MKSAEGGKKSLFDLNFATGAFNNVLRHPVIALEATSGDHLPLSRNLDKLVRIDLAGGCVPKHLLSIEDITLLSVGLDIVVKLPEILLLVELRVVATDTGGTPDMVGDAGRGRLFEPDDTKRAVMLIDEIFKQKEAGGFEDFRRLGEMARASHNEKKILMQYMNCYEDVIRKDTYRKSTGIKK